ncbi:SusD/RagB family nutrient-binding outer membrane lipoprotein [Prolixibacteraceae bacterium JC049]|nr:SusD/RagB family nutrient-binding outer membrane lipoprotein [Prolixibacteraceae bacterium JC049]
MKILKDIIKGGLFLSLLAMGIFTFSGCDDELQSINSNPNVVEDLADKYLFTNAARQVFRSPVHFFHFTYGSQYAHVYVSSNLARQVDAYLDAFTGDNYSDAFNFCKGPIRYANEVLDLTQPGGKLENPVRYAMAKVLAVYSFSVITDAWGDIPYSEGGKGQQGVLRPVYDTQKSIYTSMLEDLKNSEAAIRNGKLEQGYSGADPIFNNDLDKWGRFANSLRLRLAMRIRFADEAMAKPIIADCLSKPLIETNEQNVMQTNQDSDDGELYNPWYGTFAFWNFRLSKKYIDMLQTTADPRLPIMAQKTPAGTYVGVENGLAESEQGKISFDNISKPGSVFIGKAAPLFIITAAEVSFLRAEAALFALGEQSDANELYRKGIRLHMESLQVADAKINEYLATPIVQLSGNLEAKFEQVSNQFWIACGANFFEAWTNIRRTGYPRIEQRTAAHLSKGATNGFLPKRFLYPQTEYSSNKANVEKAIAAQGADKIDTPVWWDKRDMN